MTDAGTNPSESGPTGPKDLKRRRCNNCGKVYQPKRAHGQFCSDSCRKEWWRHGGISFAKQKQIIETLVKKEMRGAEQRVTQMVLDELRAGSGMPRRDQLIEDLKMILKKY